MDNCIVCSSDKDNNGLIICSECNRENKSVGKWLVSREFIQEKMNTPLTEELWNSITEELSGRVDNFIEEILDSVIEGAIDNGTL